MTIRLDYVVYSLAVVLFTYAFIVPIHKSFSLDLANSIGIENLGEFIDLLLWIPSLVMCVLPIGIFIFLNSFSAKKLLK
ncbi:MAG: hypothetical protein PHO62_07540 [Sulfurimonas sp.]|uniref:hypothetical protein n=1 Tax=Sulfurimonas sp. TaxID=2022749 RepID=UPI002627FCE9|nr:hypothetical protein [Sulfurimonas sp.]MDD5373258.1 hypothetical protein [Sulfurimonas sp.]